MNHNQKWKSAEQKIEIWFELCDISSKLMFEGIKLKCDNNSLADKEFWKRMNAIRQRNRLITQQAMARLFFKFLIFGISRKGAKKVK